MGQTLLIRLYGVLFCLVFALIFTGQVLSFAGHYRLLPVLAGSVLVWLAALWLYFRRAPGWPEQAFLPPATPAAPRLDALCMVLAVLALSSAFLLRLALFPGSVAGNVIAGDALSYHFVRAVELVRSGTMWDLAIAYGEYPAGYESLVSLGVLLTGTVYPAGLVHALIVLLLALTLALLLRRYTRLPAALALLLATLVLFIPDFFSQSLVVGKNDLLLSVLILAALLHSPLTLRPAPGWHVWGLAFATLMAMSVKPGGFLILSFLWLVVLWQWWQAYRRGAARAFLHPGAFVAALLIMLPCGFWVLRNVAVMGRFVSPEVSLFFQGSLLANLSDPRLYNSGPDSWLFLLFSGIVALVAVGLAGRRRWGMALLLPVLWLAFLTTPLGAFHTPQRTVLHIEWRYTTHTFLLLVLLALVLVEPLLRRGLLLAVHRPGLTLTMSVAAAGLLLAVFPPAELLTQRPENFKRLRDDYPPGVPGTGGYESLYDYVRREIHNAVIIYDGALPLLLYAPPFSNRILDRGLHPLGLPEPLPRPEPDYLVYVLRPWETQPPAPATMLLPYAWEPVYQDTRGLVYRRSSATP